MAKRETINAIVQLFQKLGGNTSDVLGTRSNVNFLGKGKSSELMIDMDINPEALAVLPRSKAVEELTNSVGYAVSGKLNDIQANQLLKNMQKMDEIYFPPAAPENVTDLATGTSGLDKAGLMSLRQGGDPTKYKVGDAITSENFGATGLAPDNTALRRARELSDDLPPPGSRGGPEDIAAPFSGTGLEAIKNVKGSNLIINDIVDKIYMNAGVSKAAQPAARGNAREFLNRIKDMEDPSFPDGPTLSSVMEADDFRFMTEGGGGGMGDPLLLVQKYFGPRVASSVAQLDSADDIQKFAERLVRVKDAKGRTITDRNFDPESVDPNTLQGIDVFDFADGGRVGFFKGALVDAEEKGTSISPGTDASGNVRDDNPFTGGGDGGGSGDNQTKFKLPLNVNIRPDYTPIGATPRYLDIAGAVKGGLLNLRTDLFNTLRDQELDSELSYTGALGPFNINAKTDFDDINQASFNLNKNNIYASGQTDFDDQNQISFGYEKGPFRAGVTSDLDGNNQFLAQFGINYADGGRVPMFAGGAARMGYQALAKYGIKPKDISRLFASLGSDKTLVGKEKTEYFRMLHKVLRNPDDFPDEILDIQKQLGIDVPGLKGGGLAGILEV